MRHIYNTIKPKTYNIIIGILGIAIIFAFILGRTTAPKIIVTRTANDQPPQIKAEQKINKSFTFPVKDDRGDKIAEIQYTIESADLQDEIIIKGDRAKAVKGRTFFILNIKIENDSNKNMQINSRDYVRISLDGSKELLASEIHNDPVQVQAISTKYTRLGFPINAADKNIILHVGEIDGIKTKIPINFLQKKS